MIEKFSSPDGQKQIAENISEKMKEYAPDTEMYKLLALFCAAVSETDLTKLNTNIIPTQPIKV